MGRRPRTDISAHTARRHRRTLYGGRGAILTGLLLSVSLGLPAAPTLAATALLDQAQPVYAGGLSVRQGASQTLTVGRNGQLSRVDLPFCTPIAGSVVALTVQAMQGPARPARGVTATLTFAQSYSDCAWDTLRFAHPLRVRRGEQVRLVVRSRRGLAPLWGASATKGDPYPRGHGQWMGHRIDDFAFRTFVR